MPVYLPPISRRRFLKGSLSAAAFLAAGRGAGHELTGEGTTWALLSDVHIAADPNIAHLGVKMTQNLQKAVDEIVAWPTPVFAALVNGDLAYDNGEVADY